MFGLPKKKSLYIKITIIVGIIIVICCFMIHFYHKKNDYENELEFKNKLSYYSDMNRNNITIEEYYQRSIYPSTYKIVVLGDVHGDFYATTKCLQKARIIDEYLNWCGGKTHVVQMGDILDRKDRLGELTDEDSEFKIIELFVKLIKQAFKAGGGFHCILGNHEFMNITGDFNYVSKAGMDHFTDGSKGRQKFFTPGGEMCRLFADYWNPVIKIGKYLFCHAGISGKIAKKYKIPEINKYMRKYLLGDANVINSSEFDELFLSMNGIIWDREYANGKFRVKRVKELLALHDCEYMVVGHTVQMDGINLKNDCIWFVDTGMSQAFGKRRNDDRLQLLQIIRNGKSTSIIK